MFADVAPSAEDLALHVTEAVRPALATLRDKLAAVTWDKASIAGAIKETLAAHGLKMPQLAPAVRVLVCGRAQTPSLDAVLEVFDRATGARAARGRQTAALAIIFGFGAAFCARSDAVRFSTGV